jgi:hypothetical protein
VDKPSPDPKGGVLACPMYGSRDRDMVSLVRTEGSMVKVREGSRGVHKRAWGALAHVSWRSVEPSLEPPRALTNLTCVSWQTSDYQPTIY